jgi:ABC-2 type transport system ATP-binding protein
MGLTPKQMRYRLDAVIDFAELRDFADLKLKNYSSGMLVRLSFAVMLEADADVLLIDEVLAVGDASFQQKCADAFHGMKADGKTIVLVTHEMGAVEMYCHRAMLISDGHIKHIGEPAEIGREYLKLNFAGDPAAHAPAEPSAVGGEAAAAGALLISCRVEGADGDELATLELGEEINVRAEIELLDHVPGLHVGLVFGNADDVSMFEIGIPVYSDDGKDIKGDRVIATATVENPLAAGRYFVHCGIQSPFGISAYFEKAASFVVYGTHDTRGLIAPGNRHEAVIESSADR